MSVAKTADLIVLMSMLLMPPLSESELTEQSTQQSRQNKRNCWRSNWRPSGFV